MDLNKKSLKEFNKIISKRKKDINLEKLFENDNYLVQTLKRTKRVLQEKPAEDLEINLDNALKTIYENIALLGDPEIKEINSENNVFKKNYINFLKTSENSNSISLNELIKHYLNNGYKIPNLDFQHNLFKVNPLIEENSNKITNYFITEHRKKLTLRDILLLKSIQYLNKLNKLIFCKQNKKRASLIPPSKVQMKLKNFEEKIEIGKLQENINFIQKLINQMLSEEKNKKNLNFNYRNSHQFLPTFKKLNSFKENTESQKNVSFKEDKTNVETKPNIDENESNDINTLKILTSEDNKNDKKHLRDYIQSQSYQKSSKINLHTRNKVNSFLPGINNKYNFSNKTIMPKLPITLRTDINFNKRKKFSHKTKFSNKTKSKDNIKDKEEPPLFVRTQVKDKKYNKYYSSSRKKNIESRNRNNTLYANSFSNKTEFFDYTYRRLKRGNFEDINKLVKKYLNEVEQKSNEEIDMILKKYDYKNFKVNLKELEINMHKKEIDRKTEKIYLNNFISKRVAKPLEAMRKNEEQISRLNKIISAIGNHTE